MNRAYTNKIDSLALSCLIMMIIQCILILYVCDLEIQLSEGFVYALITVNFAFIPIFNRLIKGNFNVFEPIILSLIMLGVLFGVRPIAMYLVGETEYFLWFSISGELDKAIFLGMIGTISYLIGYLISYEYSGKKHGKTINRVHYNKQNRLIIYLYCILIFLFSIAMFYIYISASGSVLNVIKMMISGRSKVLVDSLPLNSEYFSVAPILSACAAIIIIVLNYEKKISLLKLLLIVMLILFPVLIFLLMGVRRFIIPSIFVPLVLYYLVRRKKPQVKNLLIITPLIFILLAVIPYLRTEGARNNLAEHNGGIVEYVFFNVGKHIHRFILSHDTEMVSALSVEIGVLESIDDYYMGRAIFGDLFIAPIPSIIFPGKPMTARNGMLIDAFGMPCNATEGGLCPDFSIIGTFYQDFWYLGVLFGMFIVGCFSAHIWKKYILEQHNIENMVVLACWIIFLPIIIRAGFMPAFPWFLYFLIPSLLGLSLSKIVLSKKKDDMV